MNIKIKKSMDDFIYMEKLELKYYPEEHVTPHEEAYQWHLANPNTGFVLEDCGRIAAFTDILPIKKERFLQIAAGAFNDKYLTAEDLVVMEELKAGEHIDLLLSCVLVDDDYRDTDALKILLKAHLDYYHGFADKGICIGSVVTSNVTEAGRRFSERMGFEKIGTTTHQSVLYRIDFRKLEKQVAQMRPKLEKILLQYEKDFLDREFCSDMRRLEERFTPDFIEYGQSGAVYGRETAVRLLHGAETRDIEICDFMVHCLDRNTAEVHYTAIRKRFDDDGCDSEGRSLRTSIWVKDEDGWKLHFHQGTGTGMD